METALKNERKAAEEMRAALAVMTQENAAIEQRLGKEQARATKAKEAAKSLLGERKSLQAERAELERKLSAASKEGVARVAKVGALESRCDNNSNKSSPDTSTDGKDDSRAGVTRLRRQRARRRRCARRSRRR